jgi:hypothetical protein
LTALPLLASLAFALSLTPALAARVAVTVEKLVLGEDFIVEPTLVDLPEGQTAADVITTLLSSKFPGVEAYSSSGTGEYFYMSGIYDPSRGELLSAFSEGELSGWMVAVNNEFLGTSAGVHAMRDGDVMRWQYTKRLGADLGEDPNNLGFSTKADKDLLIWRVAEINAAGNKSAYGASYSAAMSALGDLDSTQVSVDSALKGLSESSPGPGADGGEKNSGGGCDTGAFGLAAAAVLAAVSRKHRD